jgi:hypothetical protein
MRKTVESYRTLDVNQLSGMGCLRHGCSSACKWTDANEVFSINLSAESERLHLRYKVRVGGGKWEHVAETISMSIPVVGSEAVVRISSALDLEMALIVGGASPSCTSRTAIFYVDIAINSFTQVSTKRHGSERIGEPTN